MRRVGVDIGGTNTDIVLIEDGAITLHKVPSNNSEPSEAVYRGLGEMGTSVSEVELFAHGTTVATNAVVQRRGARTGLITTQGFRDVLQIRRTTRGELYDFQWDPPAELVQRRWRREIVERTTARGVVSVEPDLEQAVAETQRLKDEGVTSVAIAFINSYRNPANEQKVKAHLQERFPEMSFYASAELLPEWREFERTSTAVVGAYVGPVLTDYLHRMVASLQSEGFSSDLLVMQSNGGLGTADSVVENPVASLMSGPAAGVIAQAEVGRSVGIPDLVGIDVGGTTTDISVTLDGVPQMRSEFEVEFGSVVGVSMIDIDSIPAGGGTVAWMGPEGLLRSGPRSAGAYPGPACFGRGGTEPTLSDAYVVLGRLNRESLLGGAMPVYADAAQQVIGELGDSVGLGAERMAAGIVELTVANIAAAVRRKTIEKGVNPRELGLVAYGGGGPTLACDVAEELEIPCVVVPRYPGLTSALGLLLTDIRHDFVVTHLERSDETSADAVRDAYAPLRAEGDSHLAREGVPEERRVFALSADLRFVGQTHELTVELGEVYDDAVHARLGELLAESHLAAFGHAPKGNPPVEIVNLRLAAIGQVDKPELGGIEEGTQPEPIGHRTLWTGSAFQEVPVYARTSLGAGTTMSGPVIVEQDDTTTVVLENWTLEMHASGNLVLRRSSQN